MPMPSTRTPHNLRNCLGPQVGLLNGDDVSGANTEVASRIRQQRLSNANLPHPETVVTKAARPEVIRPRIRLGDKVLIGPGKIELLRAVAEQGSISAAARALGMGYKRAWSLLDELQRACPRPIIETAAGGSRGGGAQVTPAGIALIEQYDELEAACRQAAGPVLAKLDRLLRR